MNRKFLLLVLLLGSSPLFATAFAQADGVGARFLESQVAGKTNEHEEQLYESATDALNDGKYEAAINGFQEVVKLHGRRADAAMYWNAYALNKDGQKEKALVMIGQLRKYYPNSKWLQQARALEIEIRSSLHQQVNPEKETDDEMKLYVLDGLMNSDPERAVPLLDKVIHGNSSSRLKDRALFVLSQSNSEKAQQILLSIAKDNNDPDMQRRAIRYLGMNGNARNRAILKEIYNSSADVNVKKAVFQGWLMSGAKDDVLAVAQHEKSPELRKEAFRYLGMMGGKAELKQLYQQSDDRDTKEALMQGMGMSGDAEGLYEIAKTDKDPVVRKHAIRNVGLFGGSQATTMLTTIYTSQSDVETKKEVINALFLHGAAKEMVAMARKETDPELKKAWVQRLSLMSSPEITEYMMELLNK
jgi:outer membrane protein assembly factor BamD (BamD/ComL family)